MMAAGASAQEAARPAQVLPPNVKITWHPHTADRYTLLRVDFDAKTRKVTFLLEARADSNLKGHDFDIHLFDGDKVRVKVIEANNQSLEGGIVGSEDAEAQGDMRWYFAKGERLRLSFELPEEMLWARVRYAVVGGRSLPSE
jgi:hypothetical protein